MKCLLRASAALLLAAPAPSAYAAASSGDDPFGVLCLEQTPGRPRPGSSWTRRLRLNAQDAQALLVIAGFCLDRGRVWAALSFAQRAAAAPEAAPDQREQSLLLAGRVHLRLGYLAQAEENFKAALRLNGDAPTSKRLAAEAMRARPRAALPYASAACADAAQPAAQRAKACLLKARLHWDLGAAARTVKSAEQALKAGGDDLDTLRLLARVARRTGKAPRTYGERGEAAAERMPLWRRGAAYRQSALIWTEAGDFSRAADNLRRALALNPYDLDALVMLTRRQSDYSATDLAKSHRAATASLSHAPAAPLDEEQARRALRDDPHDLQALHSLLIGRAARTQDDAAVELAERFVRAVEHAPLWQRADAYRLAARLWLDLRRPLRAYESLDRALDIQPDSVKTVRFIMDLEKQYRDAQDDADGEAASLAYIYFKIAELRLKINDIDGAEDALAQAPPLKGDVWRADQLRGALKRARTAK